MKCNISKNKLSTSCFSFHKIYSRWVSILRLPMTDIRVETAVSVALTASWRIDAEHDSIEVIEKPMGLYLGLIECRASFKRLILLKMLSMGLLLLLLLMMLVLMLPLLLPLLPEDDEGVWYWDPESIEGWTARTGIKKTSVTQIDRAYFKLTFNLLFSCFVNHLGCYLQIN